MLELGRISDDYNWEPRIHKSSQGSQGRFSSECDHVVIVADYCCTKNTQVGYSMADFDITSKIAGAEAFESQGPQMWCSR